MEEILLGLLYINLTMKKILFIILLCLNIQLTYGIDYSSYSNRYGGYNSVPTEQTYRRIGYTSQYGGGFSNNKSTFGYPRNTYINPKSTFGKTTYDNYHSNAIYPGNTYDNYHSNYSSGTPRRAKGSGSSDGITVTYETSWKSGLLHTTYKITYTYPDGHQEVEYVTEWFGYFSIDHYAAEQAEKRAEQWAASHSVPIGDGLVPLSLLCLGYILYRRRSNFFV